MTARRTQRDTVTIVARPTATTAGGVVLPVLFQAPGQSEPSVSVTVNGEPGAIPDPNAAETIADGPQRIRLPLAWDRDRLVITDPKALAKINRKRLSPSSMGAIHSCPARWVVEKLLPSESDPMGPAESGTSGHKVLEELFNLPGRMRTTDQADRLLSTFLDRHAKNSDLVLPDRSEDDRVEEWRGEVASAIHGLWQIEDPTKVQVASIEMGLDNVEIGGVPVIGYIDRTDFERTDGRFGRRVVDYKGLALDTPLPTPTGWSTMGDVQEGDFLLGADGLPTKIIGKSTVHHRPCYRLTFSDGTTVICDNVHLWNITESARNGGPVTKTVNADELYDMFQRVVVAEGRKQSLYIPNTAAIELPDADLPIDPYLLGAWLGDGASRGNVITVGAKDLGAMLAIFQRRWNGSVGVRTEVRGESTTHTIVLFGDEGLARQDAETITRAVLRKVRVTAPADSRRCRYNHVLAEPGARCETCTRIRSTARASAHAAFGVPTNVKPDPNACPYGHPYDDSALPGTQCRRCAADIYRDHLAGRVRTGGFNVKPQPLCCRYGHSLSRPASGSLKCPTCNNAVERSIDEALGKASNVTKKVWTVVGGSETTQRAPLRMSFSRRLRNAALLGDKHVPAAYLRASYEQRLDLLRGLMDTDGSWNPLRGRAVFVTTNRRLADAVAELVLSFGITAQRHARPYHNAVRPDATAYTVEFRPVGFNPFLLPRKAEAVAARASKQRKWQTTALATRRVLTSMEPVQSTPTQCVMVDAPDSLYLCGPTMIPTHNTGRRVPRVYGSEDKYGDQLRIYALAVTSLDGERPTSAHLYFTRLGKSIAVNLSRSALSDTERSFVSAWKKLQGFVEVSSVTGKSSPLCGWCPLASSCPIAARDGKNELRSPAAEAGQLIDIPVITPLEKVVVALGTGVDHGDFDYSAGDFADTSADDFDTRSTSDVDPVDDVASETMPADGVEPADEVELPNAALDYDPDQDFGAAAVRAAAAAPPDDEVFGSSGNATDPSPPSSSTTEAAPTRTTHDHIEGDTTMARWLEDKRWEEANSEGRLNPDSYAATAVVGLTTLAVDLLHRNGQPITKSTVRALAHTLALVVTEVQDKLQGKTNFNMGLNTRLRSSLYSTIKTIPLPFGGDAAEWESWVARAQRRLEAIVLTAEELWDKGADANAPWAGLVGLTHPSVPAPVDDIGTPDEALAG